MILCIAAKDDLSFKLLEGGQDQTSGFDYFKNISQFNDYWQFFLITWMMEGRISLDICRSIVPESYLLKANLTQRQNQSDAFPEDDQQPNKDTYDNENSLHNTNI